MPIIPDPAADVRSSDKQEEWAPNSYAGGVDRDNAEAGTLHRTKKLTANFQAARITKGDSIKLQLKWVKQAQFAGYYAAAEQGFYAEEKLDVTFLEGGPQVDGIDVLDKGGADIAVDWLAPVLKAREAGASAMNIAQIFPRSGERIILRNLKEIKELTGKTCLTWQCAGKELPSAIQVMVHNSEVKSILATQGTTLGAFLEGTGEAVAGMTYNEVLQLNDSKLPQTAFTIVDPAATGFDMLEDGLYVTEKNLKDPKFVEKAARFVRATLKGWAWVATNQSAAIDMFTGEGEAYSVARQGAMLTEVLALAEGAGKMNPRSYRRTVDSLMRAQGAVIKTEPHQGAWSHAVWNATGLK